jgi:hypothetical protein
LWPTEGRELDEMVEFTKGIPEGVTGNGRIAEIK